jgi:hypothetical protein
MDTSDQPMRCAGPLDLPADYGTFDLGGAKDSAQP